MDTRYLIKCRCKEYIRCVRLNRGSEYTTAQRDARRFTRAEALAALSIIRDWTGYLDHHYLVRLKPRRVDVRDLMIDPPEGVS